MSTEDQPKKRRGGRAARQLAPPTRMIGWNIKALRLERGAREHREIRVQDAVRESGISRTTWDRLEKGRADGISLETIERLLDYFGLDDVGMLFVVERREGSAAEGESSSVEEGIAWPGSAPSDQAVALPGMTALIKAASIGAIVAQPAARYRDGGLL